MARGVADIMRTAERPTTAPRPARIRSDLRKGKVMAAAPLGTLSWVAIQGTTHLPAVRRPGRGANPRGATDSGPVDEFPEPRRDGRSGVVAEFQGITAL